MQGANARLRDDENRKWCYDCELEITAPTTRRLQVGLAFVAGDYYNPAADPQPRLMLQNWTWEDGSQPENALLLCDARLKALRAITPVLWEKTRQTLCGDDRPRLGTWARYRVEVAFAHALVSLLGWQLDERERAIMKTLEEYDALRAV